MDARRVRNVAPGLYALAVVLAVIFAGGTVVAAVAVIGVIILGFTFRLTARGGVSPDPDRAARRAARSDRRRG